MNPADLAPGDQKSLATDFSNLDWHRIQGPDDPRFAVAYAALAAEFGAANEVEQREVLAGRLRWDSGQAFKNYHLHYEMVLVTRAGEFVAVRDHSTIVDPTGGSATLHMSHNLVAPAWRRSGIAGWLRALPLAAARAALAFHELPANAPLLQVAEMEHLEPGNDAQAIRLLAYGKAGYRKVNPDQVDYYQPDFRAPDAIDASGGAAPLPLSLLVRDPRDLERASLTGAEVRSLVDALYTMYGAGFRPADMSAARRLLRLPPSDATIPLLPPADPNQIHP